MKRALARYVRGLPLGRSHGITNQSIKLAKTKKTYDVFTRRPVPVFGFRTGLPKALGVPARDTLNEPGARSGWNESSVGELWLSDS